jgi:YHS domain-containing protein
MAKDPVCGMTVDEKEAAGMVSYQGQTYYFCSAGCKATFEKAPATYAADRLTNSRFATAGASDAPSEKRRGKP